MLLMPGLDGCFHKKKRSVYVVRDEAPHFSEVLGSSLPSLSVNLALLTVFIA